MKENFTIPMPIIISPKFKTLVKNIPRDTFIINHKAI
jgi:hypothetical protein